MEEELAAPRAGGMWEKAVPLPALSARDEPEGQSDSPLATEARPGLPREAADRAATDLPQGRESIRRVHGWRNQTPAKETREKVILEALAGRNPLFPDESFRSRVVQPPATIPDPLYIVFYPGHAD